MRGITKADSNESEIEFRIRFRDEYGIDWYEAWDELQRQKQESERQWQQTLINARRK